MQQYALRITFTLQVLVPALGSMVLTIPQRDFVWGSGLSLNPGEEGSRTQCKLNCDYGYDTDIEGNLICSCNDPCRVSETIIYYILYI